VWCEAPDLVKHWLATFSPERIILSADVREEKIAIAGWQEESTLNIVDFIQSYLSSGLEYVTCTDISKDGMLAGPAYLLYEKLMLNFPTLKIIASGGVSSQQDITQLAALGLDGAIVGKALLENKSLFENIEYRTRNIEYRNV
jgi:phosphoribosylformimino-5-aminoimidazole carboxamide ribotide isomerase